MSTDAANSSESPFVGHFHHTVRPVSGIADHNAPLLGLHVIAVQGSVKETGHQFVFFFLLRHKQTTSRKRKAKWLLCDHSMWIRLTTERFAFLGCSRIVFWRTVCVRMMMTTRMHSAHGDFLVR